MSNSIQPQPSGNPSNPTGPHQALFDLFNTKDPSPMLEEWDLAELRDHEAIVAAVPKHTDDELEELRKAVSQFGLLGPIDVLPDKRILDGHGRRAVLTRHFLDITKVQVRVHKDLADDPDRQLMFGITAGLARRQLDEAARQRLAMARYEIETRLGQARKAEGRKLGGQRTAQKRAETTPTSPSTTEPAPLGGNVAPKRPKTKPKKSRDAAAKGVGMSGRTLQKAVTLRKENAPAQRLIDGGLPPESAFKLHQRLVGDPDREDSAVEAVLNCDSLEDRKRVLREVLNLLKDEDEAAKKAGQAARPVNVDRETAAFEEDLKKLIEPVRLARISQALVELGVGGDERAAEIAAAVLKVSKILGGLHAAVTAQPVAVANPTTKTESGPAVGEVGHVA